MEISGISRARRVRGLLRTCHIRACMHAKDSIYSLESGEKMSWNLQISSMNLQRSGKSGIYSMLEYVFLLVNNKCHPQRGGVTSNKINTNVLLCKVPSLLDFDDYDIAGT